MASHRAYNYLNAKFPIKITLGFLPQYKLTRTPPPVFQGDFLPRAVTQEFFASWASPLQVKHYRLYQPLRFRLSGYHALAGLGQLINYHTNQPKIKLCPLITGRGRKKPD